MIEKPGLIDFFARFVTQIRWLQALALFFGLAFCVAVFFFRGRTELDSLTSVVIDVVASEMAVDRFRENPWVEEAYIKLMETRYTANQISIFAAESLSDLCEQAADFCALGENKPSLDNPTTTEVRGFEVRKIKMIAISDKVLGYAAVRGRVSEFYTSSWILLIGLGAGFIFVLIYTHTSRTLRTLQTRLISPISSFKNQISHTTSKHDFGDDSFTHTFLELQELFDEVAQSESRLIANEKLVKQVEVDAAQKRGAELLAKQLVHDIKSPLMALGVVAGAEHFTPDIKNLLKSSIKRIEGMLADLKKISFNEVYNQASVLKTDELASTLSQLILEKTAEHGSENITIHFSPPEGSALVFGDKETLLRILSNLINNSFEARTGICRVEVFARHSDFGLEVIVNDNGCGISQEHLEILRIRQASFGKLGGSERGLGLLQARNCVAQWRGRFRIGSKEGFGTSVTIELLQMKPEKASQVDFDSGAGAEFRGIQF